MGASVVVAQAPKPAMMRAVQQPLYDTAMYAVAGQASLSFFSNQIGTTPVGWVNAKTLAHTNLIQPGQIGSPSRFFLDGFQFQCCPSMVPDITPAGSLSATIDWAMITNTGIFRMGIGSIRDLLVCPAHDIPSGVYPTIHGQLSENTALTNQQQVYVGSGISSVTQLYPFKMLTNKGARRYPILSEENIAVTLEYPLGVAAVAVIIPVRFVMQGIFFKPV